MRASSRKVSIGQAEDVILSVAIIRDMSVNGCRKNITQCSLNGTFPTGVGRV